MKEEQDNLWVQDALAGDLEAFERLVKKYQASLLALAVNILGDLDEAGDIAQETFLQVYRNLVRFDAGKTFKTWIFSIAYKRSIDRTRKIKSFIKYFNRETREAGPRAGNPRQSRFLTIEESEIFSPLLQKLNPKERTAVSLSANEGYSAREIARVIDCSESTARVHLFNARKKLKKELGEVK